MSMHTFTCADCGQTIVHVNLNGFGGTGYATVNDGDGDKKVCYDCCAKRDIADMTARGRAVLYLTVAGEGAAAPKWPVVSNWPGTLKIPVRHRRTGRHNLAGKREDIWFTGPDGDEWHGVCYGYNTQLCHCKRLHGPRGRGLQARAAGRSSGHKPRATSRGGRSSGRGPICSGETRTP